MLSVSIGFSIFFLALRFFHIWEEREGQTEEIGESLDGAQKYKHGQFVP